MSSCAGCRFWQRRDTDVPQLATWGFCRFGPPMAGSDAWPFTTEDAWCGRHETPSRVTVGGDSRPGASMVEIEDNGIVTVTHHNGDRLELSALEGLTEADKQILMRLAWA